MAGRKRKGKEEEIVRSVSVIQGGVGTVQGFRAGGVLAGIKAGREKPDLAIIACDVPCTAAGVFTTNQVAAAPVQLCRQRLENGRAQAIIVNAGNANCAVADGMRNAERMTELVAQALGLPTEDVLAASTGVIGVSLPMEPIEKAVPGLVKSLSPEGASAAAQAIMTTDTIPKEVAVQVQLKDKLVTIGGMAKGSGMIHPNMATMLVFLTTDCSISAPLLQKAIKTAADSTFNRITVDRDTSTNDSCVILASGSAGNAIIEQEDADYCEFLMGLIAACHKLSLLIAGDAEGASHRIVVRITRAKRKEDAVVIARSVAGSPLVKAAIFGEDANFGRVLCAAGYAGVPLNVSRISGGYRSDAGEIQICEKGNMVPFDEELAAKILKEKNVEILLDLASGIYTGIAYGCDLTYDYVKINGDYRG